MEYNGKGATPRELDDSLATSVFGNGTLKMSSHQDFRIAMGQCLLSIFILFLSECDWLLWLSYLCSTTVD